MENNDLERRILHHEQDNKNCVDAAYNWWYHLDWEQRVLIRQLMVGGKSMSVKNVLKAYNKYSINGKVR